MHLTLTHANHTPENKPLWNRWALCNVCKYITSVHDTAKGFWGIGLRKSKADVAERIWDTLHRPDDTWSTVQRGHCVRLTPAANIQRVSGCPMLIMNSIKHLHLLVCTLLWCFTWTIHSREGSGDKKKPSNMIWGSKFSLETWQQLPGNSCWENNITTSSF